MKKILKFSVNFVKLFGSYELIENLPLLSLEDDEDVVILCSQYKKMKISTYVKSEIDSFIKEVSNKSTAAYR